MLSCFQSAILYFKGVRDGGQEFLDKLTPAQVETLRHVYQHKNSKEIARIMGVSPHTVDQRARQALKKMRAKSRVDAAKILASYGIFEHVTPYQSLTYQSVALENEAGIDSDKTRQVDAEATDGAMPPSPDAKQRPSNETGGAVKFRGIRMLVWTVAILFAAFLTFGVIQTLLILVGRSLV